MEKLFIFFALFFICVHFVTANPGDGASTPAPQTKDLEFVNLVKQEYEATTNTLLVDQIKRELKASYIYQAYASYFQRADVNLPGIQKFFTKASAEEKEHAQMLITYINKRGGHAVFDDLDLISTCRWMKDEVKYFTSEHKQKRMCICDFVSQNRINENCYQFEKKAGLFGFRDALAIERFVNEKLLELHKHVDSDDHPDPHLAHFLEHEFLEEQVNSIYELGNYVTRLDSFKQNNYQLGEYLFDQKLNG